MPESLRHGKKTRPKTLRNGTLIGGYVQDDVAEFVRQLANAEGKTVTSFLNAHFLRLKNSELKQTKSNL